MDQLLGRDSVQELARANESIHQGQSNHPIPPSPMEPIFPDEQTNDCNVYLHSLSNNRQDAHPECNSKREVMSPWISQTLKSGCSDLGSCSKEDTTSSKKVVRELLNPWFDLKPSFLQEGKISAQLFNIQHAEFHRGQTGAFKLTMKRATRLWTRERELAPVKIRWM